MKITLSEGRLLDEPPEGYDLRKCVMVGRQKKRETSEQKQLASDNELEDIDVQS